MGTGLQVIAPAIDCAALEALALELHEQHLEQLRLRDLERLELRQVEMQLNSAESLVYSRDHVGSSGARSNQGQTRAAVCRPMDGTGPLARGSSHRLR